MNKMLKNKKVTIFCIILFIVFIILSYMFPYSGDDWAWGSEIGIERLNTFFANYNGRYAGNLLVLALTRSKLLDAIVTGISLFLVCFLPYKFSKSSNLTVLLASTVMFFIMPKDMFAQACVWTSGYSNYIPPIIIALVYFLLIRNIFESEKPTYKPYLPIVTLVMAYVGSLFMENITLFYIVISVVIIIYVYVKYKKVYPTHLTFFIGSIAGAITMFSNGAYRQISNHSDTYRSVANSIGDLMQTISSNLNVIISYNIEGWIICTIFAITICNICYKKSKDNKKHKALIALSVLNTVSLAIICLKVIIYPPAIAGVIITIIFAGIYYLSLFAMLAIFTNEKSRRDRAICISFSAMVILVPLLIVNPIGPRCIFPAYFLEIVFCAEMIEHLLSTVKINKKAITATTTALSLATIILFGIYLGIYGSVFYYDTKRTEYIDKQVANNESVIVLCKLPHNDYLWYANPKKEPWIERYQKFHGIDENTKFKYKNTDDFNQWASDYDKSIAQK